MAAADAPLGHDDPRPLGAGRRDDRARRYPCGHGVDRRKPISNLLESRFRVLRVKARHLKQVPGRKRDGRDGHGIAQRLQHGLLKGSFIPPRPQREWRDRTRLRVQLVEEKTRNVNRLPKELEDANLKLASVATESLGSWGGAMREAFVEGRKSRMQLPDEAQLPLPGNFPGFEKARE